MSSGESAAAPLAERCQECLCPLCHDGSRCPECHGRGIGAFVSEHAWEADVMEARHGE